MCFDFFLMKIIVLYRLLAGEFCLWTQIRVMLGWDFRCRK